MWLRTQTRCRLAAAKHLELLPYFTLSSAATVLCSSLPHAIQLHRHKGSLRACPSARGHPKSSVAQLAL